jgi:hypothetical protein
MEKGCPANVSNKHAASIFRFEVSSVENSAESQHSQLTQTQKMKAGYDSK